MELKKGLEQELFKTLKFGAPGRIRTRDPLVRSQVLYPTELPARLRMCILMIILFLSNSN